MKQDVEMLQRDRATLSITWNPVNCCTNVRKIACEKGWWYV